jgi:hypothetical protein
MVWRIAMAEKNWKDTLCSTCQRFRVKNGMARCTKHMLQLDPYDQCFPDECPNFLLKTRKN